MGKERLERERENEERIQYLLQKEMEESSEEEAEEELKHNILQCLEDEVDNLEQEMRALDTQEQMIIEEEMEDLMSDEKDDDANEDNHKVQLQEIHEEIVERKKHAADKKRKVLERFQHVLDANDREGDKFAGKIIGKLDGQSDLFNSKSDNQGRKGFEDSVF